LHCAKRIEHARKLIGQNERPAAVNALLNVKPRHALSGAGVTAMAQRPSPWPNSGVF
jgi:hypothetical protein